MADVATVATVILFIGYIASKSMKGWFALSMLITATVLIYAIFISKSAVRNKTGQAILAKGENSSEPFAVNPGGKATDVDGVKVGQTVYKIPDGVHAVATDGGVHVLSLWGRLIYGVRGGALATEPDSGWKPLFEA